MRNPYLSFCIATLLTLCCGMVRADTSELEALGQALFFDTNLSLTRNLACGTCHEPGRAFSDGRSNATGGAVSLGDNGVSLGSRNAPGITYANQVPDFQRDETGEYVGGFFLDGRAKTMFDQAMEPFLNPIEMAMPDRVSVAARVRENPDYVATMQALFGDDVFADSERTFAAIVQSIVAFERSGVFAPFDSKYDRYLRGEYQMTREEELGRALFFSQLINCHSCHLLDARESIGNEVFTNHRYHNIGVPPNRAVHEINGVSAVDAGLLANPSVRDTTQAGKFRVPSLRNVAVTAPYMHNGVFRELETAIVFYDKYLVSNRNSGTNPETGEDWDDPEFAESVELTLLQQGQPITEERVRALVAFLRTLTDQRFEVLLEQ